MTIYFFTKRSDERIDYHLLLDKFFVELGNSKIFSDDECVDIQITEEQFNFNYHFYITKRNRLNNIQSLSRDFFNTNIMIEIPLLIPSYLVRKVLKVVSLMVNQFNLYVYYDGKKDVSAFNIMDCLATLDIERAKYIENHPSNYHYMDQTKLSTVLSYVEIMEKIHNSINSEVITRPYDVLYDKEDEKVCLSLEWRVGTPLVFPPYLDYVYVKEDGNLLSVIPYKTFFKYGKKYMHEIAKNKDIDFELTMDLYFMNEKNAKKCSKVVKKMRKEMVSSNRFEYLKLNEILEK